MSPRPIETRETKAKLAAVEKAQREAKEKSEREEAERLRVEQAKLAEKTVLDHKPEPEPRPDVAIPEPFTPPPADDPFVEDAGGFTMPPAGFDPGIIEGEWPESCLQRAFVDGAKWWQYHSNGATMFSSERHEAEDEAIRRYGKL